jgi:hypothetical protein
MQPDYEKPCIKRPDFTEANFPTYDYRNMENAGKFRGVGQPGKTASFKESKTLDAIPQKKVKSKVRRDHEG